ncbi:MAG: aminotransferase class I/II-fold pyridoxal phosphate-dependent enzyme [Candidatus Omnitrophota bacterium]|jgi:methionine-gamma-lyase|nr:MAG: aminotransferase class I/II-fold pyridoxal phosphate-dependent enzyme [Candidatus Omnitrophota bacterium]
MRNDSGVSRRTFLRTSVVAASAGLTASVAVAEKSDIPNGAKDSVLTSTYKSYSGHDVTSDAVHAGEDSDSSSYPIYQGTTNQGRYSRDSNPTIDSVEVKLKELEGAEHGVAAASGMAAISQTLLTFLKQDSRMVYHRCVYDGTIGLVDSVLTPSGIDCVSIDMTNLTQLKTALSKKTDVVYFEVHSNPTLDVVDVPAAVKLAKDAGAMVIVDNTWLTPYLIQPIALGADIVIHSATKYMMGHGNGLAGIACGPRELLQRVHQTRMYVGGIMAPFNAFLLHQGLKTLPMRMERHCANAKRVAEFLNDHPKIKRVHYPGLPNDPGHAVASKQLNGFGGMLGFETKEKLGLKVELCKKWVSLGDVETLVVRWPGRDDRRGIPDNYWRMSVGIEDSDDIINDLKQALDKA